MPILDESRFDDLPVNHSSDLNTSVQSDTAEYGDETLDYGEPRGTYPPVGICCLCGDGFYDWGNNPSPLVVDQNSRCCDDCDITKVAPVRLIDKPDQYAYGSGIGSSVSKSRHSADITP